MCWRKNGLKCDRSHQRRCFEPGFRRDHLRTRLVDGESELAPDFRTTFAGLANWGEEGDDSNCRREIAAAPGVASDTAEVVRCSRLSLMIETKGWNRTKRALPLLSRATNVGL